MSWIYNEDGSAEWVDDAVSPGQEGLLAQEFTSPVEGQKSEVQSLQAMIDRSPAIRQWRATPHSPTNQLRNVLLQEGINIPDGYEVTTAPDGRVIVTEARPTLRNGLIAGGALLGGGALASGIIGAAAAPSAVGAPATAATQAGASAAAPAATGAGSGLSLAQPSTAGLFSGAAAPSSGVGAVNLAQPSLATAFGAGAPASTGIGAINLAQPSAANLFGTGSNAAKGGGFISSLLGADTEDWADLGSVLGNGAEAEYTNRQSRGNFAQQYDRNALLAAENRRRDESDATRKLAQSNWIKNAPAYAPPSFQLNGRQVTAPRYPGIEPIPSSAEQKQGAGMLESQMLKRLEPGGSYQLQPLSSYANRGTMENIYNIGSQVASAAPTAVKIGKGIWDLFT